jgi:hypothetical protein
MAQKRKTNIEFVSHIMDFSRHGALMQVFVMQALEQYANRVAEAKPEDVDSGLANGEAWVGCAKELKAALERHYAS